MISAEEIKALMAKDENGLLPCPFCNTLEEIVLKANCTSPVMNRPQNVISFDITHWCKGGGLPRKRIHITGSNKEDAITTWNTRAYIPAISTLQTLLNQAAEALDNCFVVSSSGNALVQAVVVFSLEEAQRIGKLIEEKGQVANIRKESWRAISCHFQGHRITQALAAIEPHLTKEGE